MESIDALAKAVNEFEGGMVLVSHDMRLISQVAKEIWICDNKTIEKYKGDIMNFKMDMRAQMGIGDGGKLRGDASVKASDKPKPAPKKAPEPKLEVVRPVVKSIPEEKPVAVAPPTTKPMDTADDATAVTASTSATGLSAGSGDKSAASSGGPAPKKYIPPHLRKKMQQQG